MTKKPTPRLDTLLDSVQSICEKRYGRKSELARFLGVTPQFVHKWVVARDNEPGGEVTLQLLEWVRAEEDKQQKTLPTCNRQQGRKTRKPHHVNEKSNRVRKRK